ncbi:hypothetical protein [Nonomuraea sp. NPDC023979]|uniref:hypothetical protein n=1 Tax=Nonomuraea sp. NPDC023979 TaxID=3154796 RepID=UPI0033E4955D
MNRQAEPQEASPVAGSLRPVAREPNVVIRNNSLLCPYRDCGAANEIVELEVATRRNELEITANGTLTVLVGNHRFVSDGYECGVCSRPVRIPDGHSIASRDDEYDASAAPPAQPR